MSYDTGLTTRWRRRQTSPLLENAAARPAYERAFREADASLRAKFHALQTPIAADASGGDGAGAGGPRVLLVRWNRWGLFCSWNAIARAVLYAIASERARRDAFFVATPAIARTADRRGVNAVCKNCLKKRPTHTPQP